MVPLLLFSLLIGVGANYYGCPNNVTCLEKETCCQTRTGFWSCCPIENGICCNDGLHCCSNNEKCSSNGDCISSTNQISFAFPLRSEENQLKTVPCPDGNVCQDGETCCILSSGDYACCPHPDAVCCSDHIHCCPKDHTCDLETGHCKKKLDQLNEIICPDGKIECTNDATCCQLVDGNYGCCPIVDAVCCNDHVHCCPRGHICDVEHGRCVSRTSIPWSTKKPAVPIKQELTQIINPTTKNISQLNPSSKRHKQKTCPDAFSVCEDTSTCCLNPDERTWGCCPVENAVCCSDHIHCCPEHYKCDLHIFTCNHDKFGPIPILKIEEAKNKISSKLIINTKISSSISTLICPDENRCPDETTCCELQNKTFGCCPFEDGNCCSDKIHCCGKGYVCDESGNRCIRRFNNLLKMKKLINKKVKEDQLCPDGKTKCFINSTCCPNKNSNELTYSCCPYSKGVCCGSNGSVCCPNDYDCNEQQLSCELRDSIILRNILLTQDYYQCQSSDIYCSTEETCCNTSGTSDEPFACCPFSNGQCCSDGIHCCPSGTICNISTGGCD